MTYTVYILKSLKYKKSYVGMTDDLSRRIAEHNDGKSFYTKRYKPWQVIHEEKFASLQEARDREVYLKTTSGRRFLKSVFDKIN